MSIIRIATTTIIATLLAGLASVNAAMNDRDWPSVVPTPALDVPMRDTAITRGPDGTYYLTGRLGVRKTVWSDQLDTSSQFDFDNSRQIKLWKSTDLKKWAEIGVVWDLNNRQGEFNDHAWQNYPRKGYETENDQLKWGVTSPKLNYVKGNWYISLAINNVGTGLLKSTTCKPEGPYAAHARITYRHGWPSMFEDDDGSVYWLTDGGWIAKLTDDLKMLAEEPRLLTYHHDPRYKGLGWNAYDDARLSDSGPVGQRGAFMFKQDGRYYLTAADYNNRLGVRCDDTWIAHAHSIYGPYSERHIMIPHGGNTTVFLGPNCSTVTKYRGPYDWKVRGKDSQKDGPQLWATFYGDDPKAIFRDRPAFLPLEWTGHDRFPHWMFPKTETFPRKPQNVITERGPWPWMKPLFPGEKFRDMSIKLMPDGKYYLMGSVCCRPGKLAMWRSADLLKWEEMPPLWTYEQIEWMEAKEKTPNEFQQIFWDVQAIHAKGTYYIWYDIFNNDNPKARGCAVLRSKSGKMEGPYESLGMIGGQLGLHPGPINPFGLGKTPDGKVFAPNIINWKPVIAMDVDLDTPGWKFDYKPLKPGPGFIAGYGICEGGCGPPVLAGKWVFTTIGNGSVDFNENRLNTTYDINYWMADSPQGPPRPPMRTYRVAGNLFQDQEGNWWNTFFGDDHTGPWWEAIGLVAMKVRTEGKDVIIEVEENPTDHQKRIMGAGTIAEVKTVVETLEKKK